MIWIVLTAVTLGLGYYAWRLQKQLTARQQAREQAATELQAQQQQHRDSIRILLTAMGREELTYTEAALRISALATLAGFTELQKADYAPFFDLAAEAAHIPVLQKWQQLSPREQMKFTQERLKIEARYADLLTEVAQRLTGKTPVVGQFEPPQH